MAETWLFALSRNSKDPMHDPEDDVLVLNSTASAAKLTGSLFETPIENGEIFNPDSKGRQKLHFRLQSEPEKYRFHGRLRRFQDGSGFIYGEGKRPPKGPKKLDDEDAVWVAVKGPGTN